MPSPYRKITHAASQSKRKTYRCHPSPIITPPFPRTPPPTQIINPHTRRRYNVTREFCAAPWYAAIYKRLLRDTLRRNPSLTPILSRQAPTPRVAEAAAADAAAAAAATAAAAAAAAAADAAAAREAAANERSRNRLPSYRRGAGGCHPSSDADGHSKGHRGCSGSVGRIEGVVVAETGVRNGSHHHHRAVSDGFAQPQPKQPRPRSHPLPRGPGGIDILSGPSTPARRGESEAARQQRQHQQHQQRDDGNAAALGGGGLANDAAVAAAAMLGLGAGQVGKASSASAAAGGGGGGCGGRERSLSAAARALQGTSLCNGHADNSGLKDGSTRSMPGSAAGRALAGASKTPLSGNYDPTGERRGGREAVAGMGGAERERGGRLSPVFSPLSGEKARYAAEAWNAKARAKVPEAATRSAAAEVGYWKVSAVLAGFSLDRSDGRSFVWSRCIHDLWR